MINLGMKRQLFPILFCLVLFIVIIPGCTDTSGCDSCFCNCPGDNATAIGLALTNSSVLPYLGSPYIVAGINPRAETTLFKNGNYMTIKTTDVTIDTINETIHVHVDIPNSTVVSVWAQTKRFIPVPAGR
jgi:hypothetical protein